MAHYSNQTVSETLRTPVSKIKKLRYEAALKFGGRVEDQAQARLLASLANATLEPDGRRYASSLRTPWPRIGFKAS